MKVEFDAQLQIKNLYQFNIYQAYKGMQGMLSIFIPLFVFVIVIMNWGKVTLETSLLNLGLGILFLLYVPVSLWFRSKKTLKQNEVLSNPLHYEFTEEQICVTQGEQRVEFKWENIYRMVTVGDLLLIYTNRMNAYVIPKAQVGDGYQTLKDMAKVQLERHRFKLK